MATATPQYTELSGLYKRGSTWSLLLRRKNPDGTAVDLSGLTTRVMFREGSVDGVVKATLIDGAGLTIADPTNGEIALTLTSIQTALFSPGAKVYFDVEQTEPITGAVWQSPTYRLSVLQEVTRD